MSNTPDMTPILEDLAAGRIDAAEASRRIEALKSATHVSDDPVPPRAAEEPPRRTVQDGPTRWREYARETFSRVREQHAGDRPTEPADTKGLESVSIRAVGRRVRVIGDPRVSTASVEGQHVLRRTGSVMEITSEGEVGPSLDGFSMLRPPRSLEDVRNLGLGKELLVRVNPTLLVDVELTAGSLTTEGVRRLGKVRVTAGGAKITDFAEAHDVLVQAGQATLTGTVTTGRSRVRCESGSLAVNLGKDSNVAVRAEAQLGRVAWAGQHSGAGDEVVMGNGSARLDVGVVMGHATVKVGEEPAAATAATDEGEKR
ncbi:hypothetical protein GCM10027418_02970 [Mariniluteicoccus endophyticus]